MLKYINKQKRWLLLAVILVTAWPSLPAKAETIASRLSGRILLQVQANGEAWYVNPLDAKRYFLGRPADAFELMRRLGLGISESNYQIFAATSAPKFKGRILLRVQANGEAYYVDPVSAKLSYLGRPADAFSLMRKNGLGITNSDLSQIPVASSATTVSVTSEKDFNWRFNNQAEALDYSLDAGLYAAYSSSPKVYTYYVGQEPPDVREAFYGMFLKLRPEDNQTMAVLRELKKQAAARSLTSDQTAAYVMSFIQYLEYDRAKLDSGINIPYYPFETLYLQKGVCADTTFLAVLWLRGLGYGAAILDFPDSNHSAAGIACPLEDSLNGSGYCYIETTNYFPVGVVPPSITNGQAVTVENNLENLFDASRLGKMEIKQATTGKIYQGVKGVKAEAVAISGMKVSLNASSENLKNMEAALSLSYQKLKEQEAILTAYRDGGDIQAYNNAVPAYNAAVNAYQLEANAYEQAVSTHNQLVNAFNTRYRQFYQQ
ncbi:hypothetical protein CVU83_01610 [Candidatus Falkowbacteria bacterium HGW-Falkowbacteria-2]|uniref:Transglutaminase-like domain-containing protein n=1 Tax=Candidatus Falkowbacteria bacterium HGW-Falkowbacteria-2 TaxID=2013769 RepID=A0A2N2E1E2_9BACT|nr:MAG: hypothetical protein CVU83_01610 [Candidatus Falkowbacteria bacterium HGW-Falkowbacteria-2]